MEVVDDAGVVLLEGLREVRRGPLVVPQYVEYVAAGLVGEEFGDLGVLYDADTGSQIYRYTTL